MQTINKSHLIQELALALGVTTSEAENIVRSYNELVIDKVKKGYKVHTGLGWFSKSHRKERLGVNPRTLTKMKIPALTTTKFVASDTFKKAIK